MTIEEIRKGAPLKATHYLVINDHVRYLRKSEAPSNWYSWWVSKSIWVKTVWHIMCEENVKPLSEV